jgi:lysyl-tRNA synthetase class 2
MLEAYEAFGSWETMADLVEGMICHIAEKLFGGLKIVHHRGTETQREINLERPWRRVRMADLVEERTGWKFEKRSLFEPPAHAADKVVTDLTEKAAGDWISSASRPGAASSPEHQEAAKRFDLIRGATIDRLKMMTATEQLVEVYEKLVEPTLINPTFVTHIPSIIIPLAKKNHEDSYFADVYELAINGQEISPGYSELNDPDVQAANFAQQVGDEAEKQKTDEDFLTALKFGMPPAGGMGLGIDRLVMMLTGAESIRDVILFPLMRPS